MSKPFNKIHLNTTPVDERSIDLDFSSIQKDYVMVDLDFADGKTFLTLAQQWLNSANQKTLYYIALMPHGMHINAIHDGPLGQELSHKWPPLLPGLHLIELADARIQLIVGFGEPESLLKSLLWHPDLKIENSLRNWSVDVWLHNQSIEPGLIQQFSNSHTLFYPALSDHETMYERIAVNAMPWAFPKHSCSTNSEIIIIGAGLAGCYMAHLMATSGWTVKVLEALDKPALIGSGNAFSVLYPKISLHHAPFTELLHLCYPHAYACWKEWLTDYPQMGRTLSLWQQADEFHAELLDFLDGSPNWFTDEMQKSHPGLLFHHSLIMDMPMLCERLLSHPNIECHYGIEVKQLSYQDNLWQVGHVKAPLCILANSYHAQTFSQTSYLGTKGMRGQMTHTKAFHHEDKVYCQQGHFLPQWRGVHAMGASFVPNDLSLTPSATDDEHNLLAWRNFFEKELQACDSWVGVRGVSLDHLPIVGPVCDADAFYKDFAIWRHHANYLLPHLMPNLKGLYAFNAFGARGLLTIPRLAHGLKAMIEQKPIFLPTSIIQALSPARFLRKKIIKGL